MESQSIHSLNEAISSVVLGEAGKKDKAAYQRFFKQALKKFGADSPKDLTGAAKTKFYNYVDKNWKSDDEEDGKHESFGKEKDKDEKSDDKMDKDGKKKKKGKTEIDPELNEVASDVFGIARDESWKLGGIVVRNMKEIENLHKLCLRTIRQMANVGRQRGYESLSNKEQNYLTRAAKGELKAVSSKLRELAKRD